MAEQLKDSLFIILFILCVGGCSSTSIDTPLIKVDIPNFLKECISLSNILYTDKEHQLQITGDLDVLQNTGLCGCKSAALRYTIIDNASNYKVSSGIFSSIENKSIQFIIDRESISSRIRKLTVFISCA